MKRSRNQSIRKSCWCFSCVCFFSAHNQNRPNCQGITALPKHFKSAYSSAERRDCSKSAKHKQWCGIWCYSVHSPVSSLKGHPLRCHHIKSTCLILCMSSSCHQNHNLCWLSCVILHSKSPEQNNLLRLEENPCPVKTENLSAAFRRTLSGSSVRDQKYLCSYLTQGSWSVYVLHSLVIQMHLTWQLADKFRSVWADYQMCWALALHDQN